MELRQYWKVFRRWWWLAALPALVVAGFAFGSYQSPPPAYTASLRFTAAQPTPSATPDGFDPNYYRWLTSEYIVNGLADWVQTGSFAESVSRQLASEGVEVPASAVQGAIGADNVRSVLVLYFSWPDADQLRSIAASSARVLETRAWDAFPQLGSDPIRVVPMDSPDTMGIGQVPPSLRSRLDVPLKIGVGLAAGLVLAFAAHYLDPFLRERDELEALGILVIGEIPRR